MVRLRRALPLPAALLLSLLATACADARQDVTLLEWTTTAPESWVAGAPSSEMRLAEYRIGSESDPAEVVVYYFGEGQGGSVGDNLQRWTAQFSGPDGGPVEPEIERLEDTPFPTTLVRLSGTYARQIGMGGDQPGVPGQRLLSAVVETPRGNLYVQMHGPERVVAGEQQAFVDFVTGIGS